MSEESRLRVALGGIPKASLDNMTENDIKALLQTKLDFDISVAPHSALVAQLIEDYIHSGDQEGDAPAAVNKPAAPKPKAKPKKKKRDDDFIDDADAEDDGDGEGDDDDDDDDDDDGEGGKKTKKAAKKAKTAKTAAPKMAAAKSQGGAAPGAGFSRDLSTGAGKTRKRVTVSLYKGKVMVDLREYYEKDGAWLPGKKGIALTPPEWAALAAAAPRVPGLVGSPGDVTVAELGANRRLTVGVFAAKPTVGVREYYDKGGEMRPGYKGLSMPPECFAALTAAATAIDAAVAALQ